MNTPNPKGENIASSPLFKTFLGKAEEYLKKPLRIKQLLNDAYQKASEKNDLGTLAHEAWESLQVLFRLVRTSVSGEYTGVPTPTIVAAVAVLIYFLSPIDLIPDFIPVIGLLDDVALLAWFTTKLKEEMDHFVAWEHSRPTVVNTSSAMASTSGPVDSPSGAAVSLTSSDGTTAEAGPKPQNAPQKSPDHTLDRGVEAPESAKRMGTVDLNHPAAGSSHSQSNTDSGISSPDSSNPNPSLTGPNDTEPKTDVRPHADDTYNTDGSRTRNDSSNDTGGNVR
ncbi:DUF1232 domain-containing protein [Hymenobacter sp. BT188]|uniref:DUF1232 domain-containing protein n=1 Tax=Hymenobacter sp. BT188 TaxID=2763504 RepID=UPI003967D635